MSPPRIWKSAHTFFYPASPSKDFRHPLPASSKRLKLPPRGPDLGTEMVSGRLSRVTLEDLGVEKKILAVILTFLFFNSYLLKKELIFLPGWIKPKWETSGVLQVNLCFERFGDSTLKIPLKWKTGKVSISSWKCPLRSVRCV